VNATMKLFFFFERDAGVGERDKEMDLGEEEIKASSIS